MNILITGGAGYLGSILINKLIQARHSKENLSFYDNLIHNNEKFKDYDKNSHYIDYHKIIVLDNLLYRQVCLTDYCYQGTFEFIHGDVRDQTSLKKLINKADIIIPLAAIVGAPACDKDPKLAKQVNYEQIKFILSNTTKNQKIIYPNTNSGYGIGKPGVPCTEETLLNPISVYGRTKCDAEKALLDSGRAITLRLATVFGVSPRMRLDLLVNDFVYKAITDGYLVLFEKDFIRNYIHIQDVALTFIYMMNTYKQNIGNTFNVGLSSANLSKWDLAKKIKEYIPKLVIKWDNFKEDLDKRDYIVSNEKLEKLGWTPYYTLDMGIQELIKAYKIINYNLNRNFTNL